MASLISDAEQAKLRQEENNLLLLAKVVQQKKEELAAAEKALEDAEASFEWNRLQAYAAADEEATSLSSALDEAIAAFERSLVPPKEYEGTIEAYAQTDDCGDLSSVESTLDDILEEISEYRRRDVQNHLERSVAMLLLISSRFQRLKENGEGTDPKIASGANGRSVREVALDASEYDDMTQSLLDEWADTLTDLVSVGEDSALMLRMLVSKLGAPFDALANAHA